MANINIDPLSGLLGLGSFVTNTIFASRDYYQNQLWNQMNFGMALQQQRYERELQERIFEREDTAVQRRRADLEAAGMNPMLAAGSGASAGSHVPSHAPQGKAGDSSKQMDVVSGIMNLLKMDADISISREERRRLQEERRRLRNQNKFDEATMKDRVAEVATRRKRSDQDYSFELTTYEHRAMQYILANDKAHMEIAIAKTKQELYSAQVDSVQVDTALKNVKLRVEEELEKLGVQVNTAQEELLALQVATNIKYKDAQAFHDMGLPSTSKLTAAGRTIQSLTTNAARVLDDTVGTFVRFIQKKTGNDPSFNLNFGVDRTGPLTDERRRYARSGNR